MFAYIIYTLYTCVQNNRALFSTNRHVFFFDKYGSSKCGHPTPFDFNVGIFRPHLCFSDRIQNRQTVTVDAWR